MSITLRRDKGMPLTHDEMDNNFDELDKLPNGKVFPSDPDKGIKIDTNDPQWPWRMCPSNIFLDPSDSLTPSLYNYKGNVKELLFEENQRATTSFIVSCDYKIGTDIYLVFKASHNSNVVTGGTVTWSIEFIYSSPSHPIMTDPLTTSTIMTISTTPYEVVGTEELLSTPGGSDHLLDTNLLEPGGFIHCLGYLDSNDITTSDGSTVNPFIHQVAILYQSRELGTKNRWPNYYT